MSNIFKTTLLLTGMTLLLMLAGRAFGGQNGMLMALAFAAVLNFISYFFSDKIALATYRAQPVGRDDLPRVYNIVERLAQKVSLPMPKVYIIPTDSPNAFATGRNPNHASVAVTQGILGLLNDEELEGVLAHELGHVRNPYALASALAKIEAYSKRLPLVASPSTAHLFIIAPFLGGMSFGNLFSTHPPTAKRIERLTGRPAEFGQ